MKLSQKQRRIWISIAAVAAVSLVALLLLERPSGPTYKDKTVAEWLDRLPPNSAISTNVEVSGTLMTLGSNAVPALIKILDHGDSWRIRLWSAADQNWLPLPLRARAQKRLTASVRQLANAVQAFTFLGSKATAALPELERISSDPRKRRSGLMAMSAFSAVAAGQDTFPAVIRIATNSPAVYRPNVDVWLKGLLYRSYTELGLQAALALCELGSPPPEVIPPLAQCIKSRRSPHRHYALQALAGLAPKYAAARDVLREASEDDDPEIRGLAKAILERQSSTNLSKAQ